MSEEQYERWRKFDADAEVEKVEENCKVDDRDSKLAKLEKEKLDVESSVLNDSLDASESFVSKVAVDNFRKLKKGRKKRATAAAPPSSAAAATSDQEMKLQEQEQEQDPPISAPPPLPTPPTLPLPIPPALPESPINANEASALRMKKRGELLSASINCREDGKRAAAEKKFKEALDIFQSGLEKLDAYEDLLPSQSQPAGAKEPVEQPRRSKHAACCGPDPQMLKEQQLILKPPPLKTTKGNICLTLRRDFNLNIGRSYLELKMVSEASEAFKNVLVVDGGNVSAWVARAECFRRMELSTLADLHLVKAIEIDDVDRNAKAVKKMNDGDIAFKKTQELTNEWTVDTQAIGKSIKGLLANSIEMYKQGNVIFREQFFNSARDKFCKAIAYASAADDIVNQSTFGSLPGAVTSLRVACHLQAAACNLLRNRELWLAESHCTSALKLGGFNITALLRRSEARLELGKFDAAVRDLRKVEGRLTSMKDRRRGGAPARENATSRTGEETVALEQVRLRLERVLYVKDQLSRSQHFSQPNSSNLDFVESQRE